MYDDTKAGDWALNISSSTNFINHHYQQLLHELENSLQEHNIHERHSHADRDSRAPRKYPIADTNFTGQGHYTQKDETIPRYSLTRNKNIIRNCWNLESTMGSIKRRPNPPKYEKFD